MYDELYKEIYSKIPNLTDNIDKIINGVLSIKSDYSQYAGEFVQSCVDVFPNIVLSYTTEPFRDYISDIEYWKDLLKKIIVTLQDVDKYKIVDVLYFEVKPSLYEYKCMLENMGLV